jgi:hypothetical protein
MMKEVGDLVAELDAIQPGDPEEAHSDADAILLRALRRLGGDDVASAWERVADRVGGFWYA